MNSEALQNRLNDIIVKGLLEDIIKAERAYLQARTIGENFEAINASDHNIVLGMCQVAFSDAQTLAVTRMFDKPDKKFPTRSVCVILDILGKHAEELPILQPDALFDALRVPQCQRPTLEELNTSELTRAVVKHFQDDMPTDALKRLKESRDKLLAHNEAIDAAARNLPTWGDANEAVAFAKKFAMAVGEAYLGISGLEYSVNGAAGWERPMQRLLEQLL